GFGIFGVTRNQIRERKRVCSRSIAVEIAVAVTGRDKRFAVDQPDHLATHGRAFLPAPLHARSRTLGRIFREGEERIRPAGLPTELLVGLPADRFPGLFGRTMTA